MKESFWGIFVITVGVVCIFLIYLFQDVTNTDEHNYNLLKETTEGAMIDAVDLVAYRETGTIRIDREKFVENFLRRFAEDASLSKSYIVSFYDINEEPPKVSVRVASVAGGTEYLSGDTVNFDIINQLDAILETPY